MSAPATPDAVLKDLSRLWSDLGSKEEQGVLRACAMTLIVATEDHGEDPYAGELIASLMHEHPSRAILLRVGAPDKQLEARVYAQCWMPFGKRQQICCEQIDIVTCTTGLDEAAQLLAGITVPDLPVVLYCADPALAARIGPIRALATRLVVDSSEIEGGDVLKRLDDIAPRGLAVSDLAWARVTPWREAVAQLFEAPEARRAMYELEAIRILYAHSDDPASAYYLAGWFMHVLGGNPRLQIARGVGPAYGSIAKISFHGPNFEASVELVGCCAIELTTRDCVQRLVFPAESEAEALREELSIVGRDRLFEQVLGLAALLYDAQSAA